MSTLLLVTLLLPLVGGVVVAALPTDRLQLAKQLTLGLSLVVLVLTLVMAVRFDTGGERFQYVSSYTWIADFGVRFALGVDGIAVVLIALIGVLVPVVVAASWNDEPPRRPHERAVDREHAAGADRPVARGMHSMKAFFAWLLVLETMMIGVFAATDVFLFYVFFEVMLVPMYFLIGSFGGPRRQYAAVKFFLYSLLGGLIMLASVIGLFVVSQSQLGQGTFAFDALRQLEITPGTQKLLFLGFFIAFAIKAPLVPFHTWLPDAGAEAPIGGAVLLVGVLDKVGTFGFLRYCLPLFPDASRFFAPFALVLSVVGIVYAALLAMGQSDMKRLIAYTSIAHFGFIGLGIFAFTTQAGTGAVLYMVNHGISTGALFLIVGVLINRGGSRLIGDYGGMARITPLLGGAFLIAGLSSLALPGTNSFVSEFLVLIGSFGTQPVFAIIATAGIILAALYILLMYQRTMHGPDNLSNPRLRTARDLDKRELATIGPLIALIIVLGVYPKPLLDIITPAVEATMVDLGATDPAPTVAEEAGS
ncbi:MAG: NADH-quinone oxidoreductase subunit M [Geodermatophilaceae bacterium]|nr:NADH-quinone oxidoreductase subunit M [Geodermatophilaceae bacterium]